MADLGNVSSQEIEDIVEEALLVESENWLRGHYDFCIIHSEDDCDEVAEFRDTFCKTYNLEGILESDPEMMKISSNFDRLSEMVKRSTKILMYMTDNFVRDNACNLQKNELLSRHLRDPQNCSNIIPVYAKKLQAEVINFPFGLCGMTGFKMFTLNGDQKRIQNTFNANVCKAKMNRKRLEDKERQRRLDAERTKIRSELLTQQAITESSFRFSENQPDGGLQNSRSNRLFFEQDVVADGGSVPSDEDDCRKVKSPFNQESNESILDVTEACYQTTIQNVAQCQIGPVYNINVAENSHFVLYSNPKLTTSVQNARLIQFRALPSKK